VLIVLHLCTLPTGPDMLAAVTCHPTLCSLSLTTDPTCGNNDDHIPTKCTAAHLETLLTACPNLTHLDLGTSALDSQALDYLLDSSTSLDSLKVFDISIDRSRAHMHWGLKHLHVTKGHEVQHWDSGPEYPAPPSVIHLAYLPLKGLHTLQLWSDNSDPWGCLSSPAPQSTRTCCPSCWLKQPPTSRLALPGRWVGDWEPGLTTDHLSGSCTCTTQHAHFNLLPSV
jgi:hypothetical protein